MSKTLLATLALTIVAIVSLAAAAETEKNAEAEKAYKRAIEERQVLDSVGDRMAVTKRYLAEYPETKHTAALIGHVFYYQGEKLGDIPGAIAYAEEIRRTIKDPEIAKDVDRKLVELYGDAGMPDKMLALAVQLESDGEMKFTDYWKIIEYGIKAEDWEVVQQYCGKARPLATADAYRQEWSQHEFTDEQADEAAGNRKAMLAIKDGWAKANTGHIDEALADFALANDKIRRSYLDIPEYDLNLYWGGTLVMKGDYGEAIRLFAPEALIMGREEAVAGLEKAYAGMNGSETGYEEYADRLHRDIAKTVDDFDLPDYEGQMRNFTDLRGEVTLLAFWFPT